MDPFETLANAIILQAVKDYRLALSYYYHHPRFKYKEKVLEIEEFFYSRWYGILTSVDPDTIVEEVRRQVRKEVYDESKRLL